MAKKRDVEDEDEEDEEEQEQDHVRKRMKVFIDEEAEEDEDAEDEDEEDEDLADLIDDAEEEAEAVKDSSLHKRLADQQRRQDDMFAGDAEDLARTVERRYGAGRMRDDEEDYEDEGAGTGIERQSLQPTVQDPKLYMVTCRMGREREAAIRLLQKHSNLMRKGESLRITAAVAPNDTKGVIYIEAMKADAVSAAIRGVDILTERGMKLVPLAEMTDVMTVPKRQEKIAVGDWVRVTRGLYSGDLAQVFDVHEGRGDGQVTLRLIPRINYASTKHYDDESQRNRPASKLFEKEEAERLSNELVVDKYGAAGDIDKYELWCGMTFGYGMLYKRISARNLDSENVEPQVEELEKFQAADQKMRAEYAEAGTRAEPEVPLDVSSITRRRKVTFFKGDSVVFVHGDLKGLQGVIESIQGNIVTVRSKELPEPVTCDRKDLSKSFSPGDNVRIASGRHAGENGVVVDVKGDVLIVINDVTKEEVKVLASNVATGSDLTSMPDLTNQFHLFDLVGLHSDPRARGVVVKVSKNNLTLLDTTGKVVIKPVQEIKAKVQDRNVKTMDRNRRPIVVGELIRVVEGPHSNRQGTVKHLADNFVFIQAPDETVNCGILGVPARSVMVQNNRVGARNGPAFGGITSGVGAQNAAHPFMAPKTGGGFGGFGSRGRDPIVRKEVKLKSGPFKGYSGRCVDASNDVVRVELEGVCKTITVKRQSVIPKDDVGGLMRGRMGGFGGGGGANDFGTRTPHHDGYRTGARTPSHEFEGSRTPLHDSAGMRTPVREDAFRAGSRTPAHELGGSRTPIHEFGGARTPMNEFGGWRPTTPAHTSAYDDSSRFGAPNTPMTPMTHDYPYRDVRTPKTPGDPETPGLDPRTPNTPMEAPTPYEAQHASPGDDDDEEDGVDEIRAMLGVEVTLQGKRAYVKDLEDDATYSIEMLEGDVTQVKAAVGTLQPIVPDKNDTVRFIQGDDAVVGQTGFLMGVDERDGIVRLPNQSIKVVRLHDLAKVYVKSGD